MIENEGWICLYRKFLNWEWYDAPAVKIIFLHCLLAANHKANVWHGITIERGQFITSYEKLANANGLTVQRVRTALDKLKSTQEITCQSTSHYSIITVKNYDLHQTINTPINNQLTTNNNENNISNISYINTHTIEKSVCGKIKISKEDRQILKEYAKKSKSQNITAYVHTLITNGGYLEILEAEKKKQAIRKEKEEKAKLEKETQEENSPENDEKIRELLRKTGENLRRRLKE